MTALRRGNCIIEMKIAVIMRNKFLDFDNHPFNMVPLNAGSTLPYHNTISFKEVVADGGVAVNTPIGNQLTEAHKFQFLWFVHFLNGHQKLKTLLEVWIKKTFSALKTVFSCI